MQQHIADRSQLRHLSTKYAELITKLYHLACPWNSSQDAFKNKQTQSTEGALSISTSELQRLARVSLKEESIQRNQLSDLNTKQIRINTNFSYID